MKKFICDGEKYKFGDGYIYMPIKIENLPQQITINEYSLQVKPEFHCSLVCIKGISPEYGDNIEEKIIEYFCDFASKNEVSFLNYRNEFRLVKKEDKVSIVVMCDISNLENFFNTLEKEHNINADTQPTHITLYTLQPNIGIGIPSKKELDKLSTLINVSDEVRRSLLI